MSVSTVRKVAEAISGSITSSDVKKMFDAAKDGRGVSKSERKLLDQIRTASDTRFTSLAKSTFDQLKASLPPLATPVTPVTPVIPSVPTKKTHEAKFVPWTSTYWPLAGSLSSPDGSPTSNLWAKSGPLDKFDALLKARGKKEGARNFELQPNLNGLVDKPAGHFIPSSSLSEKDAERTTGVDFNGNGKIDPDVEHDFLDRFGQFGTDGKTDGSMSVGWWGFCDQVALAGTLFKEPKNDVTLDGVTFTAQDIKGLLTVIADSQAGGTDFVGSRYDARQDVIRLADGTELTGRINTPIDLTVPSVKHQDDFAIVPPASLPDEIKITLASDGAERTVKKSEVKLLAREDQRDDPAVFHDTIAKWLDEGRPAVMDKDKSEHVWNYNFYKADDTLYENGLKPSWATDEMLNDGYNGPAGDGKITYVERGVTLGGAGGSTQQYRYWLEEQNGKVVNSGWADSSISPDFLWRARKEATFTGKNPRNPFVDPALVKELYEKSIA